MSAATDRRRERGNVIVFVVIALPALLGLLALATATSRAWATRSQLQAAADASALAAAANMIDLSAKATTLPAARTAAQAIATQNPVLSAPNLALNPADIVFGNWDLATRTFDPNVDQSDPEAITAVSVIAELSATSPNGQLPAIMANILGRTGFDIRTRAIAYLGFQGSLVPGEVELPLAIDCSAIAGGNCDANYCPYIADNPPAYGDATADQPFGACTLEDGNSASCLDTFAQGDQIACWTNFSDSDTSMATGELNDIVENGNSIPLTTNSEFHIDNGVKTPVINEIANKFYGQGSYTGNAAGDPNGDGVMDGWVVKLPVVESQEDNGCARGGQPWQMKGTVCFEIQEVSGAPDKRIKGRFVCPANESDPLYEKCSGGGTGGQNFGVRALNPVLVR